MYKFHRQKSILFIKQYNNKFIKLYKILMYKRIVKMEIIECKSITILNVNAHINLSNIHRVIYKKFLFLI